MQALGLIETQGLIPAIVSADAMLKSANVSLIDKLYVGGGLVSISLEGDVGAVKVAVDAGAAALRALGEGLLISEHVIARPDRSIEYILKEEKEEVKPDKVEKEVRKEKLQEKIREEKLEKNTKEETKDKKDLNKKDLLNKNKLEEILKEYEIKDLIDKLKELKVVELRKLARKYDDFGIRGREISNGDKNQLLAEFEKYFKKRKNE